MSHYGLLTRRKRKENPVVKKFRDPFEKRESGKDEECVCRVAAAVAPRARAAPVL